MSLRVRIVTAPGYQQGQQYLFAFWHGKQFAPLFCLRQQSEHTAALVSTSEDGTLLSYCLQRLGHTVIRGSSRKRNIAATLEMLRILRRGYALGFGVDGPLGPFEVVKSGIGYLARQQGVPIVAVGVAYQRKHIFMRAWDRYQLPYPGSRVQIYLSTPLFLSRAESEESSNQQISAALLVANAKAAALLDNAPLTPEQQG